MNPHPEDLIPHRAPMLMIDTIRSWDHDTIRVEKTFRPGDYGVDDGMVLETVLIECIAQAAAAKESIDARQEKRAPSRGLLVGIEGFSVRSKLSQGATVAIAATGFRKIGPFRLIQGEITHDGAIVAEGSIRIFLMDQ